ncbi:hypothetical protein HPB51_012042 [Rhipicephalus microplus]|uniref:HTH CENPB-type domain-containing protein n=1 Tax=Rhipicephalus microplus TaxID=6941 RepID=A0A9J6F2H8_RHIMP|nr:hypothetical protein HPB51_012042 [Rhipicephalus microplus]
MGGTAVSSHASSKKHLAGLKCRSSALQTGMLSFFTPATNASAKCSEDRTVAPEEPAPTTSAKTSMSGFLLKSAVTKAEIMWCLNAVATRGSFRSTAASASLFPLMFPGCEVTEKLHLGKDKVGYTICHGIAAYFRKNLLSSLAGVPFLVVSFDESLNKVSQKLQMDVLVRYWDDTTDGTVKTQYLTSCFSGHTCAEDLASAFRKATEELKQAKILQVSMDGPNVNLKFLRSLKEELKELDESRNILDIESCRLHVMNGAYKAGHAATGWDVIGFLRSSYNLFKCVPARRADYVTFTGKCTLSPQILCCQVARKWEGTKVLVLPTGSVGTNNHIVSIVDIVKPKIWQLVDDTNILKMWIQFLIPRIEDGNNFGVSIQEDALTEIRAVEGEAAAFFDQISRYFLTRGKIIAKVAKYPHVSSGQAKPLTESVRCGVWRGLALCQRVSGVSQLLLRVGLVRLVLCVLALLCVPWRAEMAPTPPVAAPSGVKKRGQRGSYKTLTMAKKAEIIRQVEGGRPQSEVAREFSISKQTLSDYLKQKAKILEAVEKASAGTQKNFRNGSHPQLEEALNMWLSATVARKIPVSGDLLRQKAETLALRMGITGCKFSDGWLRNFKKRYDLAFKRMCGEGGSVDQTLVTNYRADKLCALLRQYPPENVFNGDET